MKRNIEKNSGVTNRAANDIFSKTQEYGPKKPKTQVLKPKTEKIV